MKRLIMICLLALSGCAQDGGPGFKFSASPRFLVAGQSNAVSPANNDPLYWSQTGKVTITDVYNGRIQRIPTQADPVNSSLVWIHLGDFMDREVEFVNIAIGSQSTEKWRLYHTEQQMVPKLQTEEFDAILWVQGESDQGEHFTEEQTYENMKWIINRSREVKPGVIWIIAIDSLLTDPIENATRRAQKRIIAEGLAWQGPDLDKGLRAKGMCEPGCGEFAGEGFKEHGRLWFEVLKPYL